jgi:ribosomal protein S18 acetylase RimI-like enzyme
VAIKIRVLRGDDQAVLNNLAEGVFDRPIDSNLTTQFLNDPRHHLIVAIDHETVVGMVSAMDYIHPDKPRELWINEVAVASAWRGKGIGKAMMQTMHDLGRDLGCHEAWVLTDRDNTAARKLYASLDGAEKEQVMVQFKLTAPGSNTV